MSKLVKLSYELLERLPFSSDIIPLDFHLFQKINWQHFKTKDGIILAVSIYFGKLPKEWDRITRQIKWLTRL